MRKLIGNKAFYKMVLIVMVPIVLQQLLTQFVGLLDNIMIGIIGDNEMTGVSLANQVLFVFNISVFGAFAGAGIFATQYFGAQNKLGYAKAFQFKVLLGSIFFILSTLLILFLKDEIINLFINETESDNTDPKKVLQYARLYLMILIGGNFFFIIKEIIATSLREQKETFTPMLAGIIAIGVNLLFNLILIYGMLGAPRMGVAGAAIATVISRIVECLILVVYVIIKKKKYTYLDYSFKSKALTLNSIITFMPKTLILFANEFLWSLGMTTLIRCYSLYGLDILASLNICNVVNNLFQTFGLAVGNAAGIILGNMLGASKTDEAKDSAYKLIFFGILLSILVTLIMIGSSFIIPNIYNTTDKIKQDAKELIILSAIAIPILSFNIICYFTLRSGGHAFLTFLFDSCHIWIFRIPVVYLLIKYTSIPFMTVYMLSTLTELIKLGSGYYFVRKGIWIKKIN